MRNSISCIFQFAVDVDPFCQQKLNGCYELHVNGLVEEGLSIDSLHVKLNKLGNTSWGYLSRSRVKIELVCSSMLLRMA